MHRGADALLGPPERRRQPETLGARQEEVLQLACAGLDTRAIAGQLQMAPRTVAYHLAKIRAILGETALPPPPAKPELTERHLEVLRLKASGLANQDIADRLGIPEGTVRDHVGHIYRHLGIRNRAGAYRSARDMGLVA